MAATQTTVDRSRYVAAVPAALGILDDFSFTLVEKAKAFAYKGSVGTNDSYLRRALLDMNSPDVQERCDCIKEISLRLQKLATSKAEQRHWLEEERAFLNGKSVKSLMLSGELSQLQQVTAMLQRVT